MKKLLLVLSIALIAFSCKREMIAPPAVPDIIKFEFSVAEQSNVSHYELEASTDKGATYQQVGLVFAMQNVDQGDYSANIKADNLFKTTNIVYVRVKVVDIDQKVMYSVIRTVTKE